MQKIVKEKGIYTFGEINHQPKVLSDTYCLIQKKSVDIKEYMDKVFSVGDVDVVLTGAGSSAFVGETLEGLSNDYCGRISRAIATTDILTNPELHLTNNKRTLLVSFARSGDSPESIAVVDLVNSYSKDIYHLIITCNKNGKLALKGGGDNSFVLLLPPNSNDKSLAMTSSFTAMLLAYLLVVKIDDVISEKEHVESLCKWIQSVLDSKEDISKLASCHFDRTVFLGTGYMLGVARESHLKLQELTDGQVVCKHDSYLGFRHGPKVVVNDTTLIVYLVSNDTLINKYEFDLIQQINENQKIFKQVIVSSDDVNIEGVNVDLSINYKEQQYKSKNEYLCIAHVVFAQLLGYYKSLDLGLDPDNPSVSGKISRVVKGVNIY